MLDQKIWVSVSVLLVAPLAFLRRLDSLKYTSGLALLAVIYLVVIVIVYYVFWPAGMPTTGHPTFNQIPWWNNDLGALARVSPIVVFAFTCHQNLFCKFLV